MRPAGALLVLFAGVALPAAGAPAPAKAACQAQYEGGQVARQAGRLLEARRSFQECSRGLCAAFVREDCVRWAGELAEQIPSVVLEVKDSRGEDTAAAQLWLDGAQVASTVPSTAIELDPGEHQLRVVAPDGASVEQKVFLRTSERERRLAMAFPRAAVPVAVEPVPPSALPPPTPRAVAARAPWSLRRSLPWLTGALTLLAGGTWAGSGLWGVTLYDQARASCHDACLDATVAPIRARFLVADVAMGVTVAAAVATLILFLTRPGDGA